MPASAASFSAYSRRVAPPVTLSFCLGKGLTPVLRGLRRDDLVDSLSAIVNILSTPVPIARISRYLSVSTSIFSPSCCLVADWRNPAKRFLSSAIFLGVLAPLSAFSVAATFRLCSTSSFLVASSSSRISTSFALTSATLYVVTPSSFILVGGTDSLALASGVIAASCASSNSLSISLVSRSK